MLLRELKVWYSPSLNTLPRTVAILSHMQEKKVELNLMIFQETQMCVSVVCVAP